MATATLQTLTAPATSNTYSNEPYDYEKPSSNDPCSSYGGYSIYGTDNDDYDLFGTANHDSIYGKKGHDLLEGYDGNDYLDGGKGNDHLYGYGGCDKLVGGDGDDYLNGYGWTTGEYDKLCGGCGKDTFIIGDYYSTYYEGYGYAKIKDFKSSEDVIQLRGNVHDYELKQGKWCGNSSKADTAIYKGYDLIAVVEDVSSLSASNFVVM